LERGLRKALEKRPVTTDSFRRLLTLIERDIQRRGRDEVTSKDIGEVIMKHLKGFDTVGYLRFASVYRSFEDASTFERELKNLLGSRGKKRRKKKITHRVSKKR
jgi:transcriptional repressor NrdR